MIIKALWTLVFALFIWFCQPDDYTIIEVKEQVSSVYWHERNAYSVATINDNKITMYRLPYEVFLYSGAEKPWYMCKGKHRRWDGTYKGSYCEIHLVNIDGLSNASLNHGKFGSGKTERIN